MNETKYLANENQTHVVVAEPEEEKEQLGRERRYTAIVLIVIALFTLGDLVEDRFDGAPWSHVLSELGVVLVATALSVYLFNRSRVPLLRRSRILKRELTLARADAQKWQLETRQLLKGLSTAIARQLDEWRLSDAEKDIALFLLKGLSHKEIAVLRQTSEQTVRQQAANIYEKSGLGGRTELSAFFLEDLLAETRLRDRADDAE